jgi:hypothetical protein
VLAIADNKGNMIAPIVVTSVNVHDSVLFDYSFSKLLELAQELNLDIDKSIVTLDSGFDSAFNKSVILAAGLIPIIKPNIRGLRNREKIYLMLDEFESLEEIYKERHTVERCFAWEDTYRKLVTRYEKLQSTFIGFRYLAYSMINFRWFFGKKGGNPE